MHACRIGDNDRILPLFKRWMDLILDGKKTLDIKGCRCPSLVGTRIWLRMSKSCLVFGSARVVSWEGPLTKTQCGNCSVPLIVWRADLCISVRLHGSWQMWCACRAQSPLLTRKDAGEFRLALVPSPLAIQAACAAQQTIAILLGCPSYCGELCCPVSEVSQKTIAILLGCPSYCG